jgi:ketosteroid isomerase-like protein
MPENVRTAIERLMVDYCYNVDAMDDMDRFLSIFTEDAVTDMTAIGLPLMNNREELRQFFEGVFETMSHHFHFISNFRPQSWDGTIGAMQAYVIGMGRAKDGNTVTVQVRYRMECLETSDGWKCRHYTISPMMPMPGSLGEIHGPN